MSAPSIRTWGKLAAVALAGALLTGCGYREGSPPPTVADPSHVTMPQPSGAVQLTPPHTPAPTPTCANPLASLAPNGAAGEPTPNVDFIRARGRLVVGLDTGSNLMSFRDPVTGEVSGFDADIAREIARDLFGDPNAIEFRLLTASQRVEALQQHTVDVVAKTMTITCERREQVDFSTQYLQVRQRLAVVAGSDISSVAGLENRRLCSVDASTSLDRILQRVPTAAVTVVPLWSDCLVLLQQQQVDAISTDDTILAGMLTQDPYLRIVGPSLGSDSYGVGIPKGQDDVTRQVNRTLERIRADGTWMNLYQRWLWALGSVSAPPPATYRSGS